jgi:PAS domain S-box-containing protein
MSDSPINVLLVEDNPGDARLIREVLAGADSPQVSLAQVSRLSEALKHLREQGCDVVLLDLSLPDGHGLETVTRMHAAAPGVPIVVLTGLDDEALALTAVRQGAQDYLVKGKLDGNLLVRAMRYAIERKKAEEALKESERRYRLLAENATDVIWTADLNMRLTYVSPSVKGMRGYTPEEVTGQSVEEVLTPGSCELTRKVLAEELALETEGAGDRFRTLTLELEHLRKDGSTFWAEAKMTFLRDAEGCPIGILGVSRDITERKKAEEVLRASENKYRRLLENLPQKIFLKDRNSVYISCNETYARDLNIRPEQIAGKTDYDFYPRDLADKYRSDDKRVMEFGKTESIEEKYVQEGKEVIVQTVKTPVKDDRGNVVGILGIFWDISERKRAEESLKEAEQRLRVIFDNARDGILLADAETKRLHTGNQMMCRMLGYTLEEIRKLGVADIHPKKDLPYVVEEFEKQLRKETTLAKDIPVKRKDGSVFYADVNGCPITLGGRTYVMGIFRDMTEQKLAEEEKRRLQEQLAQAQKMQAIGTLAGGIAHEFNNINAAIIGYVDLTLQTENLSDIARRNLETVRSSAVRGADLTKRLMAFSKKDVGEKKPVNLKDLVDEVLKLTEKEFLSEGIAVSVKHSMKVPAVMGEPGLLSQVVMNLVINARHAMAKSPVKKLTAQTGLESDRPFIRVRDTGCGIPKENMARLFEPFFTTKGSLVSGGVFDGKAHGTGLGLSVCHSIIEGHGGDIQVKSQPGRGTTFTIYFPRISDARAELPRIEKSQEGKVSRFLVVDDERPITDLLVSILAHGGHAADGFTNPKEAVRAISHRQYAVAFVDLQMPEMRGEDFIEGINRLPPERRPLKVILTGRLETAQEDYGHLDIFSTLRKPFSTQEVLRVAEEALAVSRGSAG